MDLTGRTFSAPRAEAVAAAQTAPGRPGQSTCANDCDLAGLAKEYGTPLFVVDRHCLEQSYRDMVSAFTEEGLDAAVFYSVKTNPLPDVVKTLGALGSGAEVISEFEMWLAQKLGLNGDRIVVNGPAKTPTLIDQAVAGNVALINVESLAELRTVCASAQERGCRVNIGLRVNPALRHRSLGAPASTGSRHSYMGFMPESDEWRAALEVIRDESLLDVRGIHFHIGTGIRSAAPYDRALDMTLGVWERLLRGGHNPTVIDIGGGFALPSLKTVGLWEALRVVVQGRSCRRRSETGSRDIVKEVAQSCSGRLRSFSRKHGVTPPKVYVEPGRALSGAAQRLLLTVQAVIERDRSNPVAVCDGGAMGLSPLLLTECHRMHVVGRADENPVRTYRLVGSLPTSLDSVSFGRELPELSVGDVLAVMDVGAYFTSLGNNFAGPRPAVVMMEHGRPVLIRRREDFRDMVARDLRFPDPPEASGG